MKIVLTNQHSNNRGDESAVIGVIESLRRRFGEDTKIDIILQSGKYRFITEEMNINESGMMIGPLKTFILFIWTFFKKFNLDLRWICTKEVKKYLKINEEADIVLSSCGGPYIGDLYLNHEFLHHLHLAVPLLFGKKTAFYAVSMGPLKNKLMNPLRRNLLNKVDLIILRDPISLNTVKEFGVNPDKVHLTADSCFSDKYTIKNIIPDNTIGVTPLKYHYNNINKEEQFLKYKIELSNTINTLMEKDKTLNVVFFPQLYAKHSDVTLIEDIILKLKFPERSSIFSDSLSGVKQQEKISTLKYVIATRYHSAIFACKTGVPCLCIAYEHKAKGFMNMVGLDDYCIDILEVNSELLLGKIDKIEENRDIIKNQLVKVIPEVTEKAEKSSLLVEKCLSNK
ncbi:MAG: polysaccharide pyruvyl transferase family protein [Clostridiales bacterium]